MKTRRIIKLAIICCSWLLVACMCDGDCASTWVYVNVVDSNGKNVFADPDPQFDFNSVRIIWTNKSGNVMEREAYPHNDKEISFDIFPHVNEYIIRYSDSEADTITIRSSITESKCCGETIDNFDLDVNGVNLCTSCNGESLTIVR